MQFSLQYLQFGKHEFIADTNASYLLMCKFRYIPYVDFTLYARYAVDAFQGFDEFVYHELPFFGNAEIQLY
jgi:hypothetical protein